MPGAVNISFSSPRDLFSNKTKIEKALDMAGMPAPFVTKFMGKIGSQNDFIGAYQQLLKQDEKVKACMATCQKVEEDLHQVARMKGDIEKLEKVKAAKEKALKTVMGDVDPKKDKKAMKELEKKSEYKKAKKELETATLNLEKDIKSRDKLEKSTSEKKKIAQKNLEAAKAEAHKKYPISFKLETNRAYLFMGKEQRAFSQFNSKVKAGGRAGAAKKVDALDPNSLK